MLIGVVHGLEICGGVWAVVGVVCFLDRNTNKSSEPVYKEGEV
jgi:hypothetical protein